MMTETLSKIYYDPAHEGSFSTAQKLYNVARLEAPQLTLQDTREWLSGEIAYTLHKPARRRFKRNPIIASHKNEQWQADLVDLQEYQRANQGYRYILTIVDVFSKKAWAVPLKNKKAPTVSEAFEQIFVLEKPFKLQTDKGKEFENNTLKSLLDVYGIQYFTSKNPEIKCSIVERFNRTLKSKMFKYFTAKGTRKYIDVLDDMISSYNNTVHSSIKMRPSEVSEENEQEVFHTLYGFPDKRSLLQHSIPSPAKIGIGDKVRTKYILGPFDKGYLPNWSDVIYTVEKASSLQPKPVYTIGDSQPRRYYKEDLQKVNENLQRVEKILKRRTNKGVVELLVKWLNYPPSHNSWVPESDVIDL
jgi:Chromo (CHRromatin Organisation MOdifier) domain/Integrase core domain